MADRRPLTRACGALAFTLVTVTLSLVPATSVQAQVVVHKRSGEVSGPVAGSEVRQLPFAAGHLALYWAGHPDAAVAVAMSPDGVTFGPSVDAGRDEVGAQKGNGLTYGAVLAAGGATSVRISTDRPLGLLTVLALADGRSTVVTKTEPGSPAGATVAQPAILSRADWGADESLRFDASGNEAWPPAFYPVQKLIVHHTAGVNNDPDPRATIRSIYYYHAVTQDWDDIGYNFLVDEAGRIYKGRHSHLPGTTADTITGEDEGGNGVTAAHAYQFNSGTVGVALLGTLTTQDATPAAKTALVDFLAWKADAHVLNPNGTSLYTNPVSGNQRTLANIAGHRDVEATECPGGAFYNTLPAVRTQVAARMGPADTTAPSTPTGVTAAGGKRKITLTWTVSTDTGGSGVAGYEVFRAAAAAGPFALLAPASSTTYTDSGVPRGRRYWYYVKAYDAAGNRSASSPTVTATAT